MGKRQRTVEGVVSGPSEWQGRRVFLTGHTGFKGSWLALWLQRLRAEVHGLALDPPTRPSLFEVAGVGAKMACDTRIDLAEKARVLAAVERAQPEVIFHLAAQPLVRESYRNPVETFQCNVQGTAHVMEAARQCPSVRAIIVVTTDKVYHNEERVQPYLENDRLGGADPYSASKAAAELVVASYRESFFGPDGHAANLATARAGNVIGGGDWAAERLVPDALRARDADEALTLRFPNAVRPWQHVLEPLSGYLRLAEHLLRGQGANFAKAWNFGPDASGNATVGEVAKRVVALGDNVRGICISVPEGTPHEAGLLRLDSTLARDQLGWAPRWSLDTALEHTVAWHEAWRGGANMRDVTLDQIAAYENALP